MTGYTLAENNRVHQMYCQQSLDTGVRRHSISSQAFEDILICVYNNDTGSPQPSTPDWPFKL